MAGHTSPPIVVHRHSLDMIAVYTIIILLILYNTNSEQTLK